MTKKKEKKPEKIPDMHLDQVVMALQELKTEACPEGIVIANDLGNHRYCLIASNCPEAVKLNTIMLEAKVELKDVYSAWMKIVVPIDTVKVHSIPEIDGMVKVHVMGQIIEVDCTETLKESLNERVYDKMYEAQDYVRRAEDYLIGLQSSYIHATHEANKSRKLDQVRHSVADMLAHRCYITGDSSRYLYIMPFKYNPQRILVGSDLYDLNPDDVKALKQTIYIVFPLNANKRFNLPYLIKEEGRAFSHYHGNHGDCWGTITPPEYWGGSIGELYKMKLRMEDAIVTINVNSLMNGQPAGWPHYQELITNGKFLGKEGVKGDVGSSSSTIPITLEWEEVDRDGIDEDEDYDDEDPPEIEPEPVARPGWGRRRV